MFVQILLFFFSCWIYNDFEPVIRKFIVKRANDNLTFISNIIENNLSVNIFIVIVICITCYQLCSKIWKNIYYSISQLLIGNFLLFVLSFNEFWHYNKLPLINLTYCDLFKFVIIIILIIDILKVVVNQYNKITKYDLRKKNVLFTNDKIENLDDKALRKLYAKSVMDQLLNTDTKSESFALAITGEWGSGKSTFLKCMVMEINQNNKAYVMEFNPWNSMSPQTLIKNFFLQLNNYVTPLYSPLEKSLASYVHALTQIDIDHNINQLIKLIPVSVDKSLEKLKEHVENGLKHLDKPILVIIDDIDRLEKDELFEVLRLIRNTGNFTNLIYLVAFDEKYVSQQLIHKGIYDGRLFLEKIFQAQVTLPKVDQIEVYEEFKIQLRRMIKHSSWVESCFAKLRTDEIENIKRALYSFRKAKHFARQLSMSANFLYINLGNKSFSFHDLLFIELLRYLSPSLYDILSNKPTRFLSSIKGINTKDNRFHYITETKKICDLKDFLSEQKENMQDVILNIFESLFKDEKKIPEGSIRWTDKYVNYLCLGVPQNKVSDLEFSIMINAPANEYVNEGMCDIMKKWCLSSVRKKDIKSIYDQFAKHRINRNSNKEILQYIYALFYWFEFCRNYKEELILEKISEAILKEKYNIEFHMQLKRFIIDRFNRLLKEGLHEKVAILCVKLYSYSKGSVLLVSNDDIVKIINLNMQKLLVLKNWDAMNLITNDGNRLNLVFSLSCVSSVNTIGDKIYKNLTVETVIDWFANKEQKSINTQIFKDKFNNELNNPAFIIANQELIKLFGSDNVKENFYRFFYKCFMDI